MRPFWTISSLQSSGHSISLWLTPLTLDHLPYRLQRAHKNTECRGRRMCFWKNQDLTWTTFISYTHGPLSWWELSSGLDCPASDCSNARRDGVEWHWVSFLIQSQKPVHRDISTGQKSLPFIQRFPDALFQQNIIQSVLPRHIHFLSWPARSLCVLAIVQYIRRSKTSSTFTSNLDPRIE